MTETFYATFGAFSLIVYLIRLNRNYNNIKTHPNLFRAILEPCILLYISAFGFTGAISTHLELTTSNLFLIAFLSGSILMISYAAAAIKLRGLDNLQVISNNHVQMKHKKAS